MCISPCRVIVLFLCFVHSMIVCGCLLCGLVASWWSLIWLHIILNSHYDFRQTDYREIALFLVLIPLFYLTVQCSVAPYLAQFCAFIPALQLRWGTLGELTACCV